MTVRRCSFIVHSFDTDAFGYLSAPGLLGYLIESAISSALDLGIGIESLQAQGLTWVLGRLYVTLNEAIRSKESLVIETWPSGLLRSTATREFRLWKGDREIGKATSIWFVLDMNSRTPVHPAEVMPAHLQTRTPNILPLSRGLKTFSSPPEVEHRFSVRLADIDRNQHVTAASYVAWAMEALPEEIWSTQHLESMDIQFLAECHRDSEIITSSMPTAPNARLHRISRCTDQRELARLYTTWAPICTSTLGHIPSST